MKETSVSRLYGFSMLGAWALAFGCAVGWDSFTIPWTALLPTAGPLGVALGVLAGGLAMVVVAWNFHFLLNRTPGPGGVYEYAKKAFGVDHGFLCSWFLCLTYAAIVCGDATVIPLVAHYAFGDLHHLGPCWTVGGLQTCAGEVFLSVAAVAVAAFAASRRRLAGRALSSMSLAMLAGIAACFAAALAAHQGGLSATGPAFSPDGGPRLAQIARVLAIAPWMFIGFEAVSNISGELRFKTKGSFAVMAAAIGAAVLAYAMLAVIPALSPVPGAASWTDTLAAPGDPGQLALATAARPLGVAGRAVVSVTLLCALFTNLVGNTLAASRLLCAMADDGALPPWFGRRGTDGSPRNAAIALSAVAFTAAPLGRTIVGIILDTALVGAVVAYAYASAATFRIARAEGRRLAAASGLAGIALSVAMALLFAVPNLLGEGAPMATESYLALAIWCLAGLLAFLSVFLRDHDHRFGRSAVVWISLLAVILTLSVLWVRQSVRDTSQRALVRIETVVEDSPEIRAAISDIEHASIRNSFVLIGATALAFALLFVLYRVLAHRERDTERERARAKSYFFSTVSHDIRTPLNAIIGYSEMLRAGFQTEEERVQAVDLILVSGRTLLALVNDVLDLSKLESGRMEIIPEPTDCPRLLREMADAFSASSGNRLLELRVRTGEMPHLMLDPQRLRQILFNLVGNAVKFTERGHVELRAEWDRAADAATGTFRLAVEDTGCGISMQDRDIVSNAYVQVGSRRGRNGGTGLGLAICKQLADAMGGSLDVESEIGKGSTFTVTIPGVRPAPGAPSSTQTAATHHPAPAHAASAKAAPRRVLAVDDVKINLSVLQAQLRKLGITETVPAMDGRQALDVLEAPDSSPFDLVLTDMWMPVMDGEALVRAIRDAPALRALRVIAVTADVELKDKFASMGFDDILLKPVTADKLARCLTGFPRTTS